MVCDENNSTEQRGDTMCALAGCLDVVTLRAGSNPPTPPRSPPADDGGAGCCVRAPASRGAKGHLPLRSVRGQVHERVQAVHGVHVVHVLGARDGRKLKEGSGRLAARLPLGTACSSCELSQLQGACVLEARHALRGPARSSRRAQPAQSLEVATLNML